MEQRDSYKYLCVYGCGGEVRKTERWIDAHTEGHLERYWHLESQIGTCSQHCKREKTECRIKKQKKKLLY